MSNQNFYNDLDLRYIEIGYNMTVIDRVNPGSVPFNIPILTPQMDNSSMKATKIIQRDKSKIQNASSESVELSDLEMSNYIYITVPKELCVLPSSEYYIKGHITTNGSRTVNGNQTQDSTISNMYLKGSVSDYYGTVDANTGYEKGTKVTFSGNDEYNGNENIEGIVTLIPTEAYRYIPANSKWAICFIGGDINMPRILCRLPD